MEIDRHECQGLTIAREKSVGLGGYTASVEGPFQDESGRVIFGLEEYAVVIFYCPFCGRRLAYCNVQCPDDPKISCHGLPGHERKHVGNGVGIRREWD